jgi:hypothetical protein
MSNNVINSLIEGAKEQNNGGVLAVAVVQSNGVLAMPNAVNNLIQGVVQLKAGYNWIKLDLLKDNATVEEKPRYQGGRSITSLEARVNISGIERSKEEDLKRLSNHRHVIMVVKYRNGLVRLYGSIAEPCAFVLTDIKTQQKFGQRPEYLLQIKRNAVKGSSFFAAAALLYFDPEGNLIYDNYFTPDLEISLNSLGELVISGQGANNYSIDTNGNLIYTP